MKDKKFDILYIDDEQDNLDVFESSFWREYNLHLANSAQRGFEILDKEKIHLIITDQRMPHITGVEFLEKVVRKHPEPVRMVLTGYSDMDTIIDAVNKGKIFHYITKPWKKEELKQTIDNALRTFRLEEENRILLQQLQIANKKLADMNKGLEEVVKERTIELEEKNEALQEAIFKLKNTQAQMVQSEKLASLGTLSAAIGHEINNPLSILKGGLEITKSNMNVIFPLVEELYWSDIRDVSQIESIKKKMHEVHFVERTDDIKETIKVVAQGADNLVTIVKSLKNFAGSKNTEFQTVNIQEGIDSTLLLINSKLKYSGITVEKKYQSDSLAISCLPGALNQVFMNLFVNAVDAIQEKFDDESEKGKLLVETIREDDRAIIRITDNGIGMSPQVREHIFESFYSTKSQGKGNGLGMSISKDIIERHKGEISIETEIGKGTTFAIALPILQNGTE